MPAIQIITGNIFNTQCRAVVNTVNCVGAMGAGIALECRLRYPEMYEQYVRLCRQGRIEVGRLWLYAGPSRSVLNFPTKKHWRDPSQEQFLHAGLAQFMATYESLGLGSVAFPLLGAQNGGLAPQRVQAIMQDYLTQCTVPVEIHHHDPSVSDPDYLALKNCFLTQPAHELAHQAQLSLAAVAALQRGLALESIRQLGPLTKAPGLSVALVSAALRVLPVDAGNPASSAGGPAPEIPVPGSTGQQGFGF